MGRRIGGSVGIGALLVVPVGAAGCSEACDSVTCGPFGVYLALDEALGARSVEVCANGDCTMVETDSGGRGDPIEVELPHEFIEDEPFLEINVFDGNGQSVAALSTQESGARRDDCSCAGFSYRVDAEGEFRRDR